MELLGPQAPQDPFLEEPGMRRAARGNFSPLALIQGECSCILGIEWSVGDWERFRVIFWGSHVRVVLIPAGRDSGTSRGLWDG